MQKQTKNSILEPQEWRKFAHKLTITSLINSYKTSGIIFVREISRKSPAKLRRNATEGNFISRKWATESCTPNRLTSTEKLEKSTDAEHRAPLEIQLAPHGPVSVGEKSFWESEVYFASITHIQDSSSLLSFIKFQYNVALVAVVGCFVDDIKLDLVFVFREFN